MLQRPAALLARTLRRSTACAASSAASAAAAPFLPAPLAGASFARSYSSFRATSVSSLRSSFGPLRSPLSLTVSSGCSSALSLQLVRHATKKAGGSSKNSPDSAGKRLGLKKSGGQAVKTGQIIVRQRGMTVHPGRNVGVGRDDTLFALAPGHVEFTYMPLTFHRRSRWRKFVHVRTADMSAEQLRAECAAKGEQLARLVGLHRKGVWLPSQKQLRERTKRKEQNDEKMQAAKAELEQALQVEEQRQALASHPMMRIKQQAENNRQ